MIKTPRFIFLLRKNAKGLEENLLLTYYSNKSGSVNFNWYKVAGVIADKVIEKLPKNDLINHTNIVLDCTSPKFLSDVDFKKIKDFVLGVTWARDGAMRKLKTTIINIGGNKH